MKNIYVSIGRATTPEQEYFISQLEKLMLSMNLKPRILGRNEHTSESPMVAIEKMFNDCVGTVIVAYPRYILNNALDLGSQEDDLSKLSLSTSWNQIEAGLAFSHRMPVLCFCEQSIKKTGLLEENGYWFVHKFKLTDDPMNSSIFTNAFRAWESPIKEFETKRAQGGSKLNANSGIQDLAKYFLSLRATDQVKILSIFVFVFGLGMAFSKVI